MDKGKGMSLDAVLIAGPTASGKSRLAMELAENLRGIIINADSMQVYSELAVLTARPTAAPTPMGVETTAAPRLPEKLHRQFAVAARFGSNLRIARGRG